MPENKSVLDQIKDEYARELGLDSFYDALREWAFDIGIAKTIDEIMFMDEVCRRYATACSKASLEKGADNARTEHTGKYIGSYEVDKDSITDPDNIVLL